MPWWCCIRAGNAQALLTWRANTATGPAPFNPNLVHVTPPDEHAYLLATWPGGPVLDGDIAAWPLRAAPGGPFPAGTGTVASPFNGMCMTLAADGTTVVAWKCNPGAGSQQWTGYSDGTLRINGRCLDVTGPGLGAKAKVAACTGAATQKWEIGQVSANDFGADHQCRDRHRAEPTPAAASPTAPRWSWDPATATKAPLARLLPPRHDRLTSSAWRLALSGSTSSARATIS